MNESQKDRRASAVLVEQTVIGSCFDPLLKAMKWHGSRQRLKEVMPHYSKIYNVTMFKDIFNHLNYECKEVKLLLKEVDDRLLPCLFVTGEGNVLVLIKRDKKGVHVFDGEANKQRIINPEELTTRKCEGRAYTFSYKTKTDESLGLHISWVRRTYNENKKLVHTALFLSLVLNLLALSTPLFIMGVYDRVIGASSYHMLWQFSVGIGIALCGVVVVYRMRSNLLAILGARIDKAIGNHIFERLIYLSPIYTESATVGSQVARIKDFDRLREFFSGP
ncbi:MAG: hypothetical protein K0U29_07375, partial [Gammaproteobacteria bacterium]|nr:hypothetical protein [Gammaproteobacteria bacterium]